MHRTMHPGTRPAYRRADLLPVRGERGSLHHKLGYLAVALLLAAAGAAAAGLVPGTDAASTPSAGGPVSAGGPRGGASSPALHLTRAPAGPAVLGESPAAPEVSPARLRRIVAPAVRQLSAAGAAGLAVAELGGPGVLFQAGRLSRVEPASTLKLLTTTTALQLLGPDHRFTTSVVQGPSRHDIVLVGGGDPLLAASSAAVRRNHNGYPARATLQRLAAQTAASLRSRHIYRVRLSYDDSLFTGPSINSHWDPTDVPDGWVSPTTALWVDEGRRDGGAIGSDAPALLAAQAFASQLTGHGVAVRSGPSAAVAATGARVLGAVRSAPLSQIVAHILTVSDNDGAEVLLRQAAIAGGAPGSTAAGLRVVRATLNRLGLPTGGLRMYDGSGLSHADRVPLRLLVDILQLDASPAHPQLRGVVAGLPVGGFSGSLTGRFTGAAAPGAGVVRAKTGTLTDVAALAGLVQTRSGQTLVFAAAVNRAADGLEARADLDLLAARLATCGCSR
ncbi:MAG TPA: D-alanyl-D-alanine carboxypeptidase/D-alanyl-D-alanine-endopeptidase [Nocardioidaceae bacterium]|nr:D-alanyl-D-alanine carboxypeptidase/D-alanyl-D-alanine-endopeptidase [Nocardioidaceae bacterium]